MAAPRVDFYVTEEAGDAARLRLACRIAEKACLAKQKVVCYADAALLPRLDELLWTFADGSFVPHDTVTREGASCDAPVALTTGPLPADHADVLINLGNSVPPFFEKFARVAEFALEFKEHLESFGYHPFVKTTGRKGLHVLTPIEPKWSFSEAFEAAKAVAQPFVEAHGSALTLQIKKDHRGGKVLLDIYRNRQSQTIAAAYSVRGLPGAPVSTPLQWDEVGGRLKPTTFHAGNLARRLHGLRSDPWKTFRRTSQTLTAAMKRKLGIEA